MKSSTQADRATDATCELPPGWKFTPLHEIFPQCGFDLSQQVREGDSTPAARTIEKIKGAVGKNNEMQGDTEVGSVEWHAHETIDDLLFDALAALGD